jgi:tetratricopeptide (TPR) repeat protein
VEYSMTIRNLGRAEEALVCLRETIDRFEGNDGAIALPWIAWAIRVYARILSELGRSRQAIWAHDELVALLDPGETAELREWMADAFLRKGDFLRDAGDRTGAIAAYRQAFERFSLDTEGDLPRLASAAGLEAARLAHSFLHPETSLELARTLVERYAWTEDEEVRERVALAEMMVSALVQRKRIFRVASRVARAFWPPAR